MKPVLIENGKTFSSFIPFNIVEMQRYQYLQFCIGVLLVKMVVWSKDAGKHSVSGHPTDYKVLLCLQQERGAQAVCIFYSLSALTSSCLFNLFAPSYFVRRLELTAILLTGCKTSNQTNKSVILS